MAGEWWQRPRQQQPQQPQQQQSGWDPSQSLGWGRYAGMQNYRREVDRFNFLSSEGQNPVNELGFAQDLPPWETGLHYQYAADKAAAERNAQLSRDASARIGQGIDLLQTYRPGGAASLASGMYGQQANAILSGKAEAPDVLAEWRRHEDFQARRRGNNARRTSQIIGGIAAAGSLAAGIGGLAAGLSGAGAVAGTAGSTLQGVGAVLGGAGSLATALQGAPQGLEGGAAIMDRAAAGGAPATVGGQPAAGQIGPPASAAQAPQPGAPGAPGALGGQPAGGPPLGPGEDRDVQGQMPTPTSTGGGAGDGGFQTGGGIGGAGASAMPATGGAVAAPPMPTMTPGMGTDVGMAGAGDFTTTSQAIGLAQQMPAMEFGDAAAAAYDDFYGYDDFEDTFDDMLAEMLADTLKSLKFEATWTQPFDRQQGPPNLGGTGSYNAAEQYRDELQQQGPPAPRPPVQARSIRELQRAGGRGGY